ncbi:SRPBCC family protein [Devosia sp.]|uniref:SRPBCC family protein n=1 Tax=Devosia sp. TaxID=1871048 RepID=UPI003F730737
MSVTAFELVSYWRIAAPLDRVWAEIVDVDAWPSWWRAVRKVERLRDGDIEGIGAVRRITWATALPYTITFDVESTRSEPMYQLEGRATGELNGVGVWTLTSDGDITTVRYDWRVDLGKAWMRAFAPILRPAFAWNHNVLMGWGEADLKTRLGLG